MKYPTLLLVCVSTIWAVPLEQPTKSIAIHPSYFGNDLKTIHKFTSGGSRIIGGSAARAGQFPYVVSITKKTSSGSYFCAGTLISNRWIVTAGQCVDGATEFTLHYGTNNRQGSGGESAATSEFILNPDYSAMPLLNDIGLIELRLAITFTDYLAPVDLFPTAELMDGSSTVTIGWGTTSDGDESFADNLNWVYVTTLPNEECKITYGNQITDEKVCVDGNYNEGTCSGDSGGPLIQYASKGRSIFVGVSSFISQNGCESPDPSGFTRIFPYRNWINNQTNV